MPVPVPLLFCFSLKLVISAFIHIQCGIFYYIFSETFICPRYLNWKFVPPVWCGFNTFMLCPLVSKCRSLGDNFKKFSSPILLNPLRILKDSIMSPLTLRCSSVVRPSWVSLCSYVRSGSLGTSLVALHWTCSSCLMSPLLYITQPWIQYSRWGLTKVLYRLSSISGCK